MKKFQKHVQQGLFSFNLSFFCIISIIEILGIPNTRKYFLLFSYTSILLVLSNWVREGTWMAREADLEIGKMTYGTKTDLVKQKVREGSC